MNRERGGEERKRERKRERERDNECERYISVLELN